MAGLEGGAGIVATMLAAVSVETWLQQPDGTWVCRETRERAARVP